MAKRRRMRTGGQKATAAPTQARRPLPRGARWAWLLTAGAFVLALAALPQAWYSVHSELLGQSDYYVAFDYFDQGPVLQESLCTFFAALLGGVLSLYCAARGLRWFLPVLGCALVAALGPGLVAWRRFYQAPENLREIFEQTGGGMPDLFRFSLHIEPGFWWTVAACAAALLCLGAVRLLSRQT